jgi:hypothetical protein
LALAVSLGSHFLQLISWLKWTRLFSGGFSNMPESPRIIIQYPIDEMGTLEDLDRRHRVEELMEQHLTRDSLGRCAGGEIGSGTMEVFCNVADPERALPVIVEALRRDGLLEGAVIALTSDEEERVLWPEDFKGEFWI